MKYKWLAICFLNITGIILMSFESCKTPGAIQVGKDISPLPVKQVNFVQMPFGYEANIKNFTKNLVPPFKIQRYAVINKHNPKQNDTIVKFYKGKTELFIYKTKFNQEMFFAGNITYKPFKFCNGIKIGMQRGAFFNCFTDLKYLSNDTVNVSVSSAGDMYKFVFKKDILSSISIQHYID